MSRKSLAAILVEQHQPLVIDEVELPAVLHYGQVLVKVEWSGLCGSQVGEIDGVKGSDGHLPHLLGHEGCGTVMEVGPGVTTVHSGDKVVLHWKGGEGITSPTPQYSWRGSALNAGWVTTFNEYAVVSEDRTTAIPRDFDGRHAALLGCAVTTGLGVISRDAQLRIGESIIIYGAGGVGLSVVHGAALAGAYPIIAVDLADAKLALASELGATHTINGSDGDPDQEIRQIIGTAGADVVVDNTGNVAVIERAYAMTHALGRTVLVGVPHHSRQPAIPTLPLHFGKVITGSHGGDSKPHRDIPRYISLNQAGRLNLEPMITHSFDLRDINEAITLLRDGQIPGRAMIKCST